MITTSLDVLYISIAIAVFLLGVFLSVAILYVVLILRDVVKITDKVKNMTEVVNGYVMTPVAFLHSVKSVVQPMLQKIHDKISEESDEAVDDAKKAAKK